MIKLTKKAKKRLTRILLKNIRKTMKKLKRNASGRLFNSIDVELKEDDSAKRIQIRFNITGNDYLIYANYGREPGHRPPEKDIVRWLRQKGIRGRGISIDQLAFLIARAIYEKGVPTNPKDYDKRFEFIQKAFDYTFLRDKQADKFLNDEIREAVGIEIDGILTRFSSSNNKINLE